MKKRNKKAEQPAPPPSRSPEVINAEYSALCAQLGQLTYQLERVLPEARLTLLDRIADLDDEMKSVVSEQEMLAAAKGADEALASVTPPMSSEDE